MKSRTRMVSWMQGYSLDPFGAALIVIRQLGCNPHDDADHPSQRPRLLNRGSTGIGDSSSFFLLSVHSVPCGLTFTPRQENKGTDALGGRA